MDKSSIAKVALLAMIVLAVVGTAALAARQEEPCCKCADTNFGMSMVMSSFGYLFGSGLGPILIVLVLIVAAVLIGHWVWS